MTPDVPPPTDVLTLVFCAWTAGTAAFGALTRMWEVTTPTPEGTIRGPRVQSGHFKVIWLVVAGLALATGLGYRPAWIIAVAGVLTYASIFRGLDRWAGLATAGAALAVLWMQAPLYGFAVAALLGSVTNAMLLGHWHLNQPKLGTEPIARLVWGVFAGLATYVAATALLGVEGGSRGGLVVVGGVTGIAFAVLAAGLTLMVRHLVRTRSIMSATGILYLEILLCFVSAFTGSLAALAAA